MSTLPAAIDALVTVLTRELKPAQVIDGPETTGVVGDVVWVGITPDDPTTDAAEDVAGLRRTRETFEVRCQARSWSGTAKVAEQRKKAYALVNKVSGALRIDPSLGGVVLQARVAGSLYTPYLTADGKLVVDVIFRVQISAIS